MSRKLRTGISNIAEHKLLFSFIVNLFLLFFYIVLFKPRFETNDDNSLSRIISGFSGENEPHMIFVNYVVGVFLKCLYRMNQSIPWYDLFQLFVCVSSLMAITYFLFATIKTKSNVFLVILLDAIVAYELYVKMQFTKTAGIASTAGVLLVLLLSLSKRKTAKSFIGITVGIILATIGFCFRYQMFFACGFLSAITAIALLFKTYEAYNALFVKRILICVISFAVLFGSLGLVSLINNNAYSSSGWKDYFIRYRVLRDLYDYHDLNFDEEKLINNGIDFGEIDKQMLRRWAFGDTDYFSTSNLEVLADSLADSNRNFLSFAKLMVYMNVLTMHIPFILYAFVVILYIIRNKIRSKETIIIIISICAMLGLLLYMYYMGRVLHRVDCILWYTATIPIITLINQSKFLQIKGQLTILISVFLLFQALHCSDCRILKNDSEKYKAREVFSLIKNDPEHLYLSTTVDRSFPDAYKLFDDVPLRWGENFYPISGWTSYAPFELKKLEKFHIINPLSDVVNNDSVYIIDDDIDVTIAYIRKHYNKNAKAILEKKVYNHCIYRIVS